MPESAGVAQTDNGLFVMAMFIIFVGSLAQGRRDVWQVVHQYFRVYVATVEVQDFFPPSLFPQLTDYKWEENLGPFHSFKFPGGWTIGWAMLANLLAAHFLKFRILARGRQLWMGLAFILAGIIATVLVVVTGNAQTGLNPETSCCQPTASGTRCWQSLVSPQS